jgi:hypothetical protein
VGKLLTWVVFFALAWLAWKFVTVSARKSAARRAADADTAGGKRAAGPSGPEVERMRACAHCGLHFPSSEGVQAQGQDYCCVAHRDAGPRR